MEVIVNNLPEIRYDVFELSFNKDFFIDMLTRINKSFTYVSTKCELEDLFGTHYLYTDNFYIKEENECIKVFQKENVIDEIDIENKLILTVNFRKTK